MANGDPDHPDVGGADGGMDPPPPPPGGDKTRAQVTKTEPEPKPKECGPKKRVTWHFSGGKRTGSTVEEWEYDAECNVTKHTSVDFDENGTEIQATVEGGDHPDKHDHRRKHRERWVWKPGDPKPKKYRVTTETSADGKTVTVIVAEEP
jgi:hypothetical protein